MYKKTNPIILKTTYVLAVQMLIFIGSLCLEEAYYIICVNTVMQ